MSNVIHVHSVCLHIACGVTFHSNKDTLGAEEGALIVRCPDFRGCTVSKQGVQMSPVRFPYSTVYPHTYTQHTSCVVAAESNSMALN